MNDTWQILDGHSSARRAWLENRPLFFPLSLVFVLPSEEARPMRIPALHPYLAAWVENRYRLDKWNDRFAQYNCQANELTCSVRCALACTIATATVYLYAGFCMGFAIRSSRPTAYKSQRTATLEKLHVN